MSRQNMFIQLDKQNSREKTLQKQRELRARGERINNARKREGNRLEMLCGIHYEKIS